MISKIKSNLGFFKNSLKDWSTKEMLLVIESDDWGSIRMPSKEAFDNLQEMGIKVENCPFLKYDNLESPKDFEALKDMFDNFFLRTGKRPVITANYILANPDFHKIERSLFTEYHRKFFWDFLSESNDLGFYKGGLNKIINDKYFYPQLHGLEHLNVPYWMEFLNKNSLETTVAFHNQVYGIGADITNEKRDTFLAEFDYKEEGEFSDYHLPNIKIACNAFNEFFGYRSKSFIAANYVWSEKVEEGLSEFGVEYIQSSRTQKLPKMYLDKRIVRNTGEKNEYDQTYLVRNCIFEPSTVKNKDKHLDQCFRQIRNAFVLNKPAVISMHRLNFMGGLKIENREENLELLNKLLIKVVSKWPEVKFINTEELGDRINKKG
jgi:hypothetical protein